MSKEAVCAQGKQMERRPWSDVPVDILNFVIGGLPMVIDKIRSRFVSQHWHLAEIPQYERNVPWLLVQLWHFYLNNGSAMTEWSAFHIPSLNNQFYITKNIMKEEKERAGIWASRYCWWLLQRSQRASFSSLFSRQAIELPDTEITCNSAPSSSSPSFSEHAASEGNLQERELNGQMHMEERQMEEGQMEAQMEEGQIESGPWSELPVDILDLIIERLPKIVDQIRFRSVCRDWHLAREPQYERNVPWLLGHFWYLDLNNGGAMTQHCSFHIPSCDNQFHSINKIVREEQELFGAGICASKYGWLLLQKSQKAFFYSPFARKSIKLPNMEITFNRATFSSSPISPDCICFAIQSSKSSDKISISTCSPADLKWCTIDVDGFEKAVEDVVYSNGIFYCVFSGGLLGAFHVAGSRWSVLNDMQQTIGYSWSRSQLVESNGELLLACRSQIFRVFKFDWSEMRWKVINKLGNQALFLGCSSFAVATEGTTSALADRIYYHGDMDRTCFYYLKTNKNYICEDLYPWLLHNPIQSIWIEPPPC